MTIRHRLTTVALATALTAGLAAPAQALSLRGLLTLSEPTTQEAPQPAPQPVEAANPAYVNQDLIGLPGSLYEVTTAMGVSDTSPTGKGIGIALIDTGISDVPALRGSNVTLGPDFSIDALRGLEPARDRNGHGTHLASLMVGTDQGWVDGDHRRLPGRQLGSAPDAELISIKVGAEGGAVDVSQVIAAINWTIEHKDEHGIRVLSLSYGTNSTQGWREDPLSYAVQRAWHAGIVVVVSTGNAGQDAQRLSNPAQNPWIIAVGAADTKDGAWLDGRGRASTADFSQGTNGWLSWIEHIAPGRSIVGARLPGGHADQVNAAGRIGDDLVKASGSSQSTALLSGLIASLLEARPGLTPDAVKSMLEESGRRTSSSDAAYQWAKFPNLAAAIEQSAGLDLLAVVGIVQKLALANGHGSLDAARGTQRIVMDDEAISGEIDLFGLSWEDSRWTEDAWTGDAWTGSSWNAQTWNAQTWNGNQWQGNQWQGNQWQGNQWQSESWNGNQWQGNQWQGNQWQGNQWQGRNWA